MQIEWLNSQTRRDSQTEKMHNLSPVVQLASIIELYNLHNLAEFTSTLNSETNLIGSTG